MDKYDNDYGYDEDRQILRAQRAITFAESNSYNFVKVEMTAERSASFSDSLHKDMDSIRNYEFVE
ncbi:hypothetical protein RPN16_24600 [Salmonella enterica]|uniref:hypothetical protein n=1 Tax=Salmonella enterica TaxID=28901 RepID=UPI002AFF56E0|nr:hypothetical protein [Salmonella enterica]